MTGIPSIVAGLFAFALFTLIFGPGIRLGVMGSIALSVLMIPIVIRSAEEILKIVPNHLREASYALGTPKWKTITKVVLPTALAGLVTGVMLASPASSARRPPAGHGRRRRLDEREPVRGPDAEPRRLRLQRVQEPRRADRSRRFDRAWSAALTLILIVMILNIAARLPSFGTEIRRRGRRARRSESTDTPDSSASDRERRLRPSPSSGEPAREQAGRTQDERRREVNLFYGDFKAVEDVSITIRPNKVTALIGSSGCGKTTFLRSINRMHELTPGARVDGEVTIDDVDIYDARVDPVQVRRHVGMVFQQPNPFPTMSIYENVAAGLQPQRHEDEEAERTRSSSARCAARTSGKRSRTASTSPASASPAASSSGSASPARSPSSPRCC